MLWPAAVVYDYLRGKVLDSEQPSSIVVCVVPLQSIMTDQYERFTQHGVTVQVAGGTKDEDEDDNLDNVRDGKAQLIYISPEALLTNLHWRELLRSQVYQENLVAFAVDEAHTVKKW